jgi:predicted O-methyltransferase YrrM
MTLVVRPNGPIYDLAFSYLKLTDEYKSYCNGTISVSQYEQFVDRVAGFLIAAGLPSDDVHFAKRYPRCEEQFVHDKILDIYKLGMLPHTSYNSKEYEYIAKERNSNYDHGPFRTYIYPEEAHLLFAIVDIIKPRSVLFLGSYYGYWAYAPIFILRNNGGHATLLDPDPVAQSVAQANIARAGLQDTVEIAVMAGETYLDKVRLEYDFVVLDAENPRNHPNLEQRGKKVYGSLLQRVLPHMTSGAYLVCHNILFKNASEDVFFEGIIQRNKHELSRFMALIGQHIPNFVEVPSTEGVGIGRKVASR